MAKEKKDKKPIYKRWWFWVIIVIIGIGALGSEEDSNNTKKEEVVQEETEDKKENTKKDSAKKEDTVKKQSPENENKLSNQKDDLYAMLDNTSMKVNIKTATKYFIEEFEKQKIKKVNVKSTAVYSDNPVKDQSGQEFPYSFLVQGRYEEKGTGKMADFIMTLGYQNDEKLDKGLASCIQYINGDTDVLINNMSEEDDVILKLMEAAN